MKFNLWLFRNIFCCCNSNDNSFRLVEPEDVSRSTIFANSTNIQDLITNSSIIIRPTLDLDTSGDASTFRSDINLTTISSLASLKQIDYNSF